MLAELRNSFERYVRFTDAEWMDIASHWKELTFARNEFVVEARAIDPYFYFVVEGVQRAYYTDDAGNEITLAFSFDHSYSGIYESFTLQAPSELSLQAITDSKLLGLEYEALQALFDRYPKMDRWGRLFITDALIGRGKREIQLATMSAEQRYRRLLAQSPRVVELVQGKHLASYLGMTPETLSRMRKRIAQES